MKMNAVNLYCGDVRKYIPRKILEAMYVLPQAFMSQREIYLWGRNLVTLGRVAPVNVFSNNELVLYGLRLVLKEMASEEECKRINIWFFSEQYPTGTVINIDVDGNLSEGPEGFFDLAETTLLKLL